MFKESLTFAALATLITGILHVIMMQIKDEEGKPVAMKHIYLAMQAFAGSFMAHAGMKLLKNGAPAPAA